MHQGAALEVRPLDWGRLEDVALGPVPQQMLMLDRVTDPHNVGAIRSAEVLGASAVIAPRHHAAPETGALADRQRCAGTPTLSARAQPSRCHSRTPEHGLFCAGS